MNLGSLLSVYWSSWSDFWAMGGYAIYVWGSMGVTAALLALEVWQARAAHRRALRELAQLHALNESD
jgi:heme exporter protein D